MSDKLMKHDLRETILKLYSYNVAQVNYFLTVCQAQVYRRKNVTLE